MILKKKKKLRKQGMKRKNLMILSDLNDLRACHYFTSNPFNLTIYAQNEIRLTERTSLNHGMR